jgi:hypothetical protein
LPQLQLEATATTAATAQIQGAVPAHTTVELTRASLHIQIQEVLHTTETTALDLLEAMDSVALQVSVQAVAAD